MGKVGLVGTSVTSVTSVASVTSRLVEGDSAEAHRQQRRDHAVPNAAEADSEPPPQLGRYIRYAARLGRRSAVLGGSAAEGGSRDTSAGGGGGPCGPGAGSPASPWPRAVTRLRESGAAT